MNKLELMKTANEVRKGIVTAVHSAKAGHPGGSLSAADIFTYLYFEEMNVDAKDPKNPDRDRFVLSKGHTAPGLYSVLAQKGYFPIEDLKTLRHTGSYLQGHPDMKHIPGVDMTSGSLGQGISAAVGMAIAGKLQGKDYRVYTLLGDGEIQEGQVWEAAMLAGHKKLDNLVVIVDNNNLQIDGAITEVNSPYPIDKKFEAFNFHVINIDGNDFDQIEPPFANGEGSIMGLNLEWKRFTTWNMNDFMNSEIQVLKEITPDIPVTANFMMLYNGLDYRKMAPFLDVISWDSYPQYNNDYESLYETMTENGFHHAVMRGLKKDKPFMLMESAPGLVNWHPYNKVKRPGVHKLACMQAIACGSDTAQYFQWRKGRGSFEQYHGAVVDHLGKDDTRIFREVAEVGALLKKIAPAAGTLVKAKTALLFDWDNRWAIQDVKALSENTKNYEKTCIGIWKEFQKLGVEMDVVSSNDDLSDYKVVVAPMLYLLQSGTAENLQKFVKNGGQLLATYFTGYVDKDTLCYLGGFPGDGLAELFGVISEEIDTLYPSDRNSLCFLDGKKWTVYDYAEILRVQDAQILASYGTDFYEGSAALTVKEWESDTHTGENGRAYYIAARVAPEEMGSLFETMLANCS